MTDMLSPTRPRSIWVRLFILPVAVSLVAATNITASAATSTSAAGHHAAARAQAARVLPPRLHAAAARTASADRSLVATAKAARRCLREHPKRPRRCSAVRRALQQAGNRLARAQRSLSAIAATTAGATIAAGTSVAPVAAAVRPSPRNAPQITVSGDTLSWTRVDGVGTYVLVRKVPGQQDQYSVVTGTAVTPPPVPGVTVRYSVRTTALWSAWASEVSISYPTASEPPEVPNTQAAPALTVSGQKLVWNAVAGVTTYVLVRKVPGVADQYSVVSGTSITPEATPGATVRYSVRTAVDGGAWAPEVTIAYPALQLPPPPVEPAGAPAAIQTGLNSGHEPGDFVATAMLGAKLVRLSFPIEDTAAQLEPTIAKYAAQGVRVLPLAEFGGRMPTPAEAQNLATWAAAFGPGGTFWAGRSDGSLAIQAIEFGNETDYSQQYHDEPGDASYRLRAEAYAVRVKEAAQSIQSRGSTVGLLVQADDTSGDWINGMYAAVPDLTKYVAGWTMHPYGGREYNEYRFRTLIKQATEHGASSVPIDVTEWGVTTDNGRCLEYNDGLNRCMTYQEAAQEVRSSFAWMKGMLGSKLATFIFYQTGDQSPTGVTTNWQGYFGALQHDLQPKGAYTEAVEALLRS